MAEISTIARPYASALFSLAKEKKCLAGWSKMLGLLSVVVSDPQAKAFISNSKILDSEREKVILELCKSNIDKNIENLIKLLIENKRLLVLPEIAKFYEELKDADEGVVEAHIIMAEKPTKKIVDDLIKSLEKRFNKKIESKVEINKSILGGTKIIVGDTVIDASVRGQLDNLAYTLKA
ncbi:MAG: F0F1 ATP synthase subunit delta [Nitrosomonadales bacterium]|jgi:F-type H+-transporting ATPase subunit delta|nr:F0F1 ATP synthase subunit delta [Nitrosomonadales bacterium]